MLHSSEILRPKTKTPRNSTLFFNYHNCWMFHLLFLQYPWTYISSARFFFFWNSPQFFVFCNLEWNYLTPVQGDGRNIFLTTNSIIELLFRPESVLFFFFFNHMDSRNPSTFTFESNLVHRIIKVT